MENQGTYEGLTAEQWRAKSKEQAQQRQESWERSDTDGFMSQWASGVSAVENELKAVLAERGAWTLAPAVFDLLGNLVPAQRVQGDYGMRWQLLNNFGNVAWTQGKNGYFNPSQARAVRRRIDTDAKNGFYEGWVKVPAVVDIRGGSLTSVRAGIFPATELRTAAEVLEVIDNGWAITAITPGHVCLECNGREDLAVCQNTLTNRDEILCEPCFFGELIP